VAGAGWRRPPGWGGEWRRLPNGLEVAQLNRNETEILYREVFEDEGYLRHGVTLRDGDVVIDVGANVGLFTLFVHSRARGARTYSFEPIPETYAALSANYERYGLGGRALRCGAGREAGRAVFTFYPRVSASSGMYADAEEEARVTRAFVGNQGGELAEHAGELVEGRFEGRRVECELRTVSGVMRAEGLGVVDLLKVDAEKAEEDVLLGVEEGDWAKVRQVAAEVHDKDGRLQRIVSLLESKGFRVHVDQYAPFEHTGLYNIFAVHPSREEARAGSDNGQEYSTLPLLTATPTASELRERLAARLPEYMTPSQFVFLDALPRMPNGKLDRRALPEPEQQDGDSSAAEAGPPATPVEEVLAAVWQEVLGVNGLSRHDNFFELGGHSLMATQVVSRLRRVLRVEMPLRLLFESPTLEGLGREVEKLLGRGAGEDAPPLEKAPRTGRLPLSFAQQRLWFLDQLEPGSPA
jgi:FkbM family methyltransferase